MICPPTGWSPASLRRRWRRSLPSWSRNWSSMTSVVANGAPSYRQMVRYGRSLYPARAARTTGKSIVSDPIRRGGSGAFMARQYSGSRRVRKRSAGFSPTARTASLPADDSAIIRASNSHENDHQGRKPGQEVRRLHRRRRDLLRDPRRRVLRLPRPQRGRQDDDRPDDPLRLAADLGLDHRSTACPPPSTTGPSRP